MTAITLVGPGAIGLTVAGALFDRADVELTIAARTPFDRVELTGLEPPVVATPTVITDPAAVHQPADIVLLATKTHQTEAAAGWLAALCRPDTLVVVLQNGIGHRDRVEPLVGGATVVPAVVNIPAERHTPGRVHVGGVRRLTVPDDAASHHVAELFAGTYLDVECTDDWHTAAWRKLVFNAAIGAVTTLTQRSNTVLADPEVQALATTLLDEAVAVARADGADLPLGMGERVLAGVAANAGDHTSSITADRIAGRPTEWDARNADVIRRADQHGVDVPLLRVLTTLLRLGEPAG